MIRTMARVVSPVFLLVAVACQQQAARGGTGCTKDTDCKGSRVCQNAACVDPQPSASASPATAQVQAPGRSLQAQIDAEQDKQRKLQVDLDAAKASGNGAQIAALQQELQAEQARLQSLQTSQKKVGGVGSSGKPCACAPGDLLCSCP